jgi:bifunctional DNA-binding transcriptional regulator/antitoxin component of YhaV-PrlF toxin-antitoxin module
MNLGVMSAVISISKRGTLTLPKEFWTQLGLFSSGRIVAQETKHGILLRPESSPATKTYSKAKVARIARAAVQRRSPLTSLPARRGSRG